MGATNIAQKFNLQNYVVHREKDNFDLSIWEKQIQGKVVFVLENKFKSIPTIIQLDEYQKKVCKINKCNSSNLNCEFVLLTLCKKYPDHQYIQNQHIWKEFCYDTYSNTLRSCSFSGFDQCLVNHYCNFITDFSTDINNDLRRVTTTDDIFSDKGKSLFAEYRKIRMHDIWQKLFFSGFACDLQQKLTTTIGRIKLSSNSNDDYVFSQPIKSTIHIGIGYGTGGGFLEIKFLIDQSFAFIIQVQNGQYRRGVIKRKLSHHILQKPIHISSILPQALNSVLLFFSQQQNVQSGIPFPFGKTPNCQWNCFGNNQNANYLFVYQYVKMTKIFKHDLLNAIIDDVQKILNLFP